MLEKTLVESKKVRLDHLNFDLDYYILKSEYYEFGVRRIAYGVEIAKRIKNTIHYDAIGDITPSYDTIAEVVDKLRRNTVTPIALIYTIDELL